MKKGGSRMTKKQMDEVETIINGYLDDIEIVRGRVFDKLAGIIRQNPQVKDEVLYTLAREAGSDIACDAVKGLRKRLRNAEKVEVRADLYRKYEGVIKDE